jgi:biopolymer transport protein ExbD
MKFRRAEPEMPELNVVSFIDVLLMLLVFFMLSTTFIQSAHLKIQLPKAAVNATPMKSGLVISIDRRGRYYVDQEALSRSSARALDQAIRRFIGHRRQIPVTIRADARVPYQFVVTALNAVGRLGLHQINLVTVGTVTSPPAR